MSIPLWNHDDDYRRLRKHLLAKAKKADITHFSEEDYQDLVDNALAASVRWSISNAITDQRRFGAYAKRVVMNRVQEAIRQRYTVKGQTISADDIIDNTIDEVNESLEDKLFVNELIDKIRSYVISLFDEDGKRMEIFLLVQEGLDAKKIAEITGYTYDDVRGRISEINKAMREYALLLGKPFIVVVCIGVLSAPRSVRAATMRAAATAISSSAGSTAGATVSGLGLAKLGLAILVLLMIVSLLALPRFSACNQDEGLAGVDGADDPVLGLGQGNEDTGSLVYNGPTAGVTFVDESVSLEDIGEGSVILWEDIPDGRAATISDYMEILSQERFCCFQSFFKPDDPIFADTGTPPYVPNTPDKRLPMACPTSCLECVSHFNRVGAVGYCQDVYFDLGLADNIRFLGCDGCIDRPEHQGDVLFSSQGGRNVKECYCAFQNAGDGYVFFNAGENKSSEDPDPCDYSYVSLRSKHEGRSHSDVLIAEPYSRIELSVFSFYCENDVSEVALDFLGSDGVINIGIPVGQY